MSDLYSECYPEGTSIWDAREEIEKLEKRIKKLETRVKKLLELHFEDM